MLLFGFENHRSERLNTIIVNYCLTKKLIFVDYMLKAACARMMLGIPKYFPYDST